MKLDPPSDLQSNISSGSCVLTWSISLALEPLTTLLSYELAFKRQEEAWEVTLAVFPWGLLSWEQQPRVGFLSLTGECRRGAMRREIRARCVCVHWCVCVHRHVLCMCTHNASVGLCECGCVAVSVCEGM